MNPSEYRKISPVVISTALGQAGRGIFPYTLLPGYRRLLRAVRETGTTVFTKSATRFTRRGNFIPANPLTWRYIRRLPDLGMLNAYGLTNHGVAVCAPEIRRSGAAGLNVIPNLYPEFIKGTATAIRETLEALEIYRQALGPHFWALELNYSCPNSAEEIVKNVDQGLQCSQAVRRQYPDLFLIAKISFCHPYEFAQELERSGSTPSTPSTPSPTTSSSRRIITPARPCGRWAAAGSPAARPGPRPMNTTGGCAPR